MRQVNEDELIFVMVQGLASLGPSLLKQLADGRQNVARDARYVAARKITPYLGRWEILSTAPEPPVFKRGGGAAPVLEGEE